MKPNTCLVVDVWEGQLEIDEAILKSNGVSGIGIRINNMNGGHHLDSNFKKQWEEAKSFVRFPYFVYNPWVSGTANFSWLIGNLPTEVKVVAVDIEVVPLYGLIKKPLQYANDVAEFLALCKARNIKTIIYTAQWFLQYLSQWPKDVDYWWAQYPDSKYYFGGVTNWSELKARLDRLDKPFNSAYIPGTLKMWQFSGDYLTLPGTIRKIDVNIFYGTEEELATYFGWDADIVDIKSVTKDGVKVPEKLTVNYSHKGVDKSSTVDQTPVVIPPTPVPTLGVYRILDDVEAMAAGSPRPFIRDGLPATVRLHQVDKITGKPGDGFIILSDSWMKFAEAINPGPAFKYQFDEPGNFKEKVGWHNQGTGISGNKRVECLTMAGNIVEVYDIRDVVYAGETIKGAFIKHYTNNSKPPAVRLPMTPVDTLIHNFSIQYKPNTNHPNGWLDMSTDGRFARIFPISISENEELWIDLRDITKVK